MKGHELKRAKRDVRRRVLALRDAIPETSRAAFTDRIHGRFLTLPEVVAARRILLFWSFGSEVPTQPMLTALHDRGVRLALPRIEDGDLELRTYVPGDPMTETSFGAMEPADGALVAPAEVDVVCTPAVAFDRAGGRIGYGGGFYDRLFPRMPDAARIGIAFGVQLLAEDLPAGAFDLRVDALVTEEETLRWDR